MFCVWPQPNAHFSYKFAFCRDKTMVRQMRPFVVGVRFGLKKKMVSRGSVLKKSKKRQAICSVLKNVW